MKISTHTLRGERDIPLNMERGENDGFQLTRSVGSVTELFSILKLSNLSFQLTRSVGSVTVNPIIVKPGANISTHTLRGERDVQLCVKRRR